MEEDPGAEGEQIDLVLLHLLPEMPFSIPNQYGAPNDNAKTKHLDSHVRSISAVMLICKLQNFHFHFFFFFAKR